MAKDNNINICHIGFTDRKACDLETFIHIINIIEENSTTQNKTLVHCLGGIGRTNMVLAGYLMKKQNIPPSEAITQLKNVRKLIMTTEQIMFLKSYYRYLSEFITIGLTEQNLNLPKQLNNTLLMMIGLPCSGKSTLSLDLIKTFGSEKIIHLNQDEIGKAECENFLSSNAKKSNVCIILDRCNLTKTDRDYWINMYKNIAPGKTHKVIGLCLNLGLDTSLDRLKKRQNHPTLHNTTGGENIIRQSAQKLTLPNAKSESQFDEIIIINSIGELNIWKQKIGINCNQSEQIKEKSDQIEPINSLSEHTEPTHSKPIKFPRTKHLANLGAMSRDDLLMEKTDIDQLLKMNLLVEEKIDGANLGFSLDENNNIRAQNRSHYVCSTYHAQFKKLDEWIDINRSNLLTLLQRPDGHKYIVYGEWLYSKHSIEYTKLPSYFIMFDLYDHTDKKFIEREIIEQIIAENNLTINLVPIIFRGKSTVDKLKAMVHTKSNFYDGPVEGVYIRAFDKGQVKYRCKIVRSDFISGNQHWTKEQFVKNGLKQF